jgi:hypothetical protein
LGDGQTMGDSQTLGDSQTSKNRRDFEIGRNLQKLGGSPETPKVGGTLKNGGEQNPQDLEIGGILKTGGTSKVVGSVEDHRRPRNLLMGPPSPSLDRMMGSGRGWCCRGRPDLTINHAMGTMEERRFHLVEW